MHVEEDKDFADKQLLEKEITNKNKQANKQQINAKREADSSDSKTAKKANLWTVIDIAMEEKGKSKR
eukprot:2762994-Ditylum_brightwellii.AAC.1